MIYVFRLVLSIDRGASKPSPTCAGLEIRDSRVVANPDKELLKPQAPPPHLGTTAVNTGMSPKQVI